MFFILAYFFDLLSSFSKKKKEKKWFMKLSARSRVRNEQNNFFVLCFPRFSSLSRAVSFSAQSIRAVAARKDGNGLHCARCYAVFGYTFLRERSFRATCKLACIHALEHAMMKNCSLFIVPRREREFIRKGLRLNKF